ncbi:MAG: squalene/phytoene synthase family protein [Candidatus Eremiobacteraeota bacterium]|nr:squalene/phytoene synthase family protein [Candidatus Eremiobacteraeota bacterium]
MRPANGPTEELRAADAYCRMLAARHYENFTVASKLLPPPVRLDLARVYAFCRTTDDLGDESGSRDDALARLARWRAEVERLFAGDPPVHPVLIAVAQTIARFSLGAQPFLDLIAANEQDQRVASYESWDDLLAYCRNSAAPVGRMVLGIFGMGNPEAERLSDDVCIGLQLANFAQDVARDESLGRTYLVQSDIRALGRAGATQAMVVRARDLLQSGRRLERMAPFGLRLQLALYRLGGLAICDAIAAIGYRTDLERPTVSKRTKLGLVMRAAF